MRFGPVKVCIFSHCQNQSNNIFSQYLLSFLAILLHIQNQLHCVFLVICELKAPVSLTLGLLPSQTIYLFSDNNQSWLPIDFCITLPGKTRKMMAKYWPKSAKEDRDFASESTAKANTHRALVAYFTNCNSFLSKFFNTCIEHWSVIYCILSLAVESCLVC